MRWAQNLYDSVLPPLFVLEPKETELLQKMYPNVCWDDVKYCAKIPWFMKYSFAIAVALPSTFHRKQTRLFFRRNTHHTPLDRVTTIVHEAFHAQQYCDLDSRLEMGYFRRFVRYYIGWYLVSYLKNFRKVPFKKLGYYTYRYHTMEITAYDQEHNFEQVYASYTQLTVDEFLFYHPHLIVRNAGSIPRPPFWAWVLGSILAVLSAFIKVILEVLLLIIAVLFGARPHRGK